MMPRVLVAIVLALVVAAPAAQAEPGDSIALALPGREYVPYPIVAQGRTLTFANLDPIARHDLISSDFDPVTEQPLFFTDGTLGFGETAPVHGVERLEEGDWPFFCTLHAWMNGVLLVRRA